MYLPPSVQYCIRTLEQAHFSAYAVGGCVRDALLDLTPQDYDLCTDATPQDLCRLFQGHTLVRSGEKHGTIGVVVDGKVYEITTFRTEGSYTDGRHPDKVAFVTTLEEDLSRRDFTVNAMAFHPEKGLIDPWGGRQDLENKILRTVGDPERRFREDALRILRGVRFAVRFGLKPEPQTRTAMDALAPQMGKLAKERIFDELCKLLPKMKAADLLEFAPVLFQVLPVLAPMKDFQQHTHHHKYDVLTHTAMVLEATPEDLPLRWAALLHDTGKPAAFTLDENGQGHFKGHAAISARLAEQALLDLKAPTALRERVVFLIEHHMLDLTTDKRILRRWLGKYSVDAYLQLLSLQQADAAGKGVPLTDDPYPAIYAAITEILQEDACLSIKDLAVSGNDLISAGFTPGPNLGKILNWLLERVQDETLPNEKQALLDACKHFNT